MSKNLAIADLLDLYGDMLTDQDLSLGEIAEHEKITRQGVRDSIKRGEAYLLEMEEKLHFAEKFRRLVAVTEEITSRCIEIQRVNRGFTYSQSIDENARAIGVQLNRYLDENFG